MNQSPYRRHSVWKAALSFLAVLTAALSLAAVAASFRPAAVPPPLWPADPARQVASPEEGPNPEGISFAVKSIGSPSRRIEAQDRELADPRRKLLDRETLALFRALRPGMAYPEVVRILRAEGGPRNIGGPAGRLVWRRPAGASIEAFFELSPPAWRGRRMTVAIASGAWTGL